MKTIPANLILDECLSFIIGCTKLILHACVHTGVPTCTHTHTEPLCLPFLSYTVFSSLTGLVYLPITFPTQWIEGFVVT